MIINKSTDDMGYRELSRFCNSVLNLIDLPIFQNDIAYSHSEIEIGYDVRYDSTYIQNGLVKLYAEDYDDNIYRERL